jgi:hypothetical protein
MSFATFAQFGAALCESAGVAFPDPTPAPDGIVAFHLIFQDVVVNLAHLAAPGNQDVFILVTFGTVPQDLELQVLRLMLDANFSMLGGAAPVFGRNPETEEVVLRQVVRLSEIDAPEAFAAIGRSVELARQWRANPTLTQPDSPAFGMAPHKFA